MIALELWCSDPEENLSALIGLGKALRESDQVIRDDLVSFFFEEQ
jgi:hypothetical protein